MRQDEIQGLVKSAYDGWGCSAFRLLRIADAEAAGRWLADELARITFVEGDKAAAKAAPERRNLALTCEGMHRLGLPLEALRGFDAPFREGMTSEARARLLGDVHADGADDRQRWTWGLGRATPQLMQMLYARSADALEALLERARAESEGALTEVAPPIRATLLEGNAEHFRFTDGLSQPRYAGVHADGALATGELLLGYPDATGNRAEGPGVDPSLPGAAALPSGPEGDGDFGLNGAYLVCRQMTQDVAGFEAMLAELGARPEVRRWSGLDDSAARKRWVAARIVSRWPDDTPLATHPDAPDPGFDPEDDFDFADDQAGQRCPFGSHIRRTNPRDSVFEPWRSVTAEERAQRRRDSDRRRLLRRGRAYGPVFEDDPEAERGLLFIALCADIERQFEFVQKSWLLNPSFAGLHDETDPLVGVDDTTLTLQASPFARRLTGVRAHARTVGGAYFFLPSRSAIRYLALASQAAKTRSLEPADALVA